MDPKWVGRKEELRKLCNNIAVCPVCREPVICKFGPERIHHFAHSPSANCPGDLETEEHMRGKAILYDFLQYRYKDLAEIDLECVLSGLSTLCDILIKFPNGKRWAIEFYSGHVKEAKLKEKIDYYDKEKIDVLWLITDQRFKKIENDCLKIKSAERSLIRNTGIDRFYPSDWYKIIVKQKVDYPIPKHGINRGSLYYFSVENKSVIIARGIKETGHVAIFKYGTILEGALKEIVISAMRNVWCFEQETDWRSKLKEAEETLEGIRKDKELAIEKLAKKRKQEIYPSKSALLGYSKDAQQNWPLMEIHQNDSQILSQQQVKYICIECNRELFVEDMVMYKLDTKKGSCRDCMRKKS